MLTLDQTFSPLPTAQVQAGNISQILKPEISRLFNKNPPRLFGT